MLGENIVQADFTKLVQIRVTKSYTVNLAEAAD
jgi:hypothetical protein